MARRRKGEWVWTTPDDMEAVREEKGLQQEAFAGLLGFSGSTYGTWVDGTRVARPTSQRKIAERLLEIRSSRKNRDDSVETSGGDEIGDAEARTPGNGCWSPASWATVSSPADGAVRIVAAYLRASGEAGKVPTTDEVVGFTERLLETLGGK